LLLEADADVNAAAVDSQDTPLHEAARHGNADNVDLLLAHFANPGLANRLGEKPADLAKDEALKEKLTQFAWVAPPPRPKPGPKPAPKPAPEPEPVRKKKKPKGGVAETAMNKKKTPTPSPKAGASKQSALKKPKPKKKPAARERTPEPPADITIADFDSPEAQSGKKRVDAKRRQPQLSPKAATKQKAGKATALSSEFVDSDPEADHTTQEQRRRPKAEVQKGSIKAPLSEDVRTDGSGSRRGSAGSSAANKKARRSKWDSGPAEAVAATTPPESTPPRQAPPPAPKSGSVERKVAAPEPAGTGPPVIRKQPQTQAVKCGPQASCVFFCEATGEPPLSYAWLQDGHRMQEGNHEGWDAVTGASRHTLIVRNLRSDNWKRLEPGRFTAGVVTCEITNARGRVLSQPAKLECEGAPRYHACDIE